AHEVRVGVAAGAAGRQGVVAGVDVVRTDLVTAHLVAGHPESGHEPGGDRGLALAGGRRGDDEPGQGYHSMPLWPFWPTSIGCLTLLISVTRSAASTRRGSALRPVMITCWKPGRFRSVSTTSSTSNQPHFIG